MTFTDCTDQIKSSLKRLLDRTVETIERTRAGNADRRLLQTRRLALSNCVGKVDRGVFKWGLLRNRKPYRVFFVTPPPVVPTPHPLMDYNCSATTEAAVSGDLRFGTDVVVVTIKDEMDRDRITKLPGTVRLIVTMSAGLDHVDTNTSEERSIRVTRAACDQIVRSVSNYTLSTVVFAL